MLVLLAAFLFLVIGGVVNTGGLRSLERSTGSELSVEASGCRKARLESCVSGQRRELIGDVMTNTETR